MNCPRCNSDKIIFLFPANTPGILVYLCKGCGCGILVQGNEIIKVIDDGSDIFDF